MNASDISAAIISKSREIRAKENAIFLHCLSCASGAKKPGTEKQIYALNKEIAALHEEIKQLNMQLSVEDSFAEMKIGMVGEISLAFINCVSVVIY